jgi:hypothetical protein
MAMVSINNQSRSLDKFSAMIKRLASVLLISVSLTIFPHQVKSNEPIGPWVVIAKFIRQQAFDHDTAQSVIDYYERGYEQSDKVNVKEAASGGHMSMGHFYFYHSWGTAEREIGKAESDRRKIDNFFMIKKKMDAAKAANDMQRWGFWELVTEDLWPHGIRIVDPETGISYMAPRAAYNLISKPGLLQPR